MTKTKQRLRIVLGIAFVLAGLNHFRVPAFYITLMPDYIPAHAEMVYLSGFTEVVTGAMLLFPRTLRLGAWLAIAHLVVFFTVHIWMLQHASQRYTSVPEALLWVRLIVQFVLIAWAYWYTIDSTNPSKQKDGYHET